MAGTTVTATAWAAGKALARATATATTQVRETVMAAATALGDDTGSRRARYDGGGGGHGDGVGSDNRSGGRRLEGTPSVHGCKGTSAGAMRTREGTPAHTHTYALESKARGHTEVIMAYCRRTHK